MRVVNNPSTTLPRQPKYRTRLCRYLASGDCPFGAKCKFFHPAPSAHPSCSVPAPQLFNWNRVLPQLLAVYNQQAVLKNMPPRSPSWYQKPQLVDEETPLTQRTSKRKKFPCRHFVRTGGWCPAGEHCRFHHDVAESPREGAAKTERAPCATDAFTGGRTVSGGVLMGIQSTSPPVIAQARSESPHPTGSDPMQPRSSPRPAYFAAAPKDIPDQSMYWPNYAWQPYQPYYPAVPILASAPPSVMPCSDYPPPRSQAPSVPTGEAQTRLLMGSYEVNGTTYFPASMPSVSTPSPMTHPIPLHPTPQNRTTIASIYPYHAPHTQPAGYHDVPKQMTNVALGPSFDPFGSDPMMPSDLPVIPRLEDYQISPIEDAFPLSVSSAPPWNANQVCTIPARWPTTVPEYEFPYHPPKDQKVGHARRISVTVKTHGRAHSG